MSRVAAGVTFLLTEVVGSAVRWDDDEAAMAEAAARLDGLVAGAVGRHRGTLVKPRGEGDSHFLVFDEPLDAVACAAEIHSRVAGEGLPPLRSACHLGPAQQRDGDWYGTTVNRCARLRAAAHGGQALLSAEVAAAVAAGLPAGMSLRSLGRHRLKDLDEPVEVFELRAPGLEDDHPPLATVARRHGLPLPHSSFVGRSGELAEVASLLAAGQVVALVGAPGVGTTRLALEAAREWWQRTGGEVHLVEAGAGASLELPDRRPDELVVLDVGTGSLVGPAVRGPALVTGPGSPGAVAVRVRPLDPLESARLLADRLAEGLVVEPGLVERCDGLPLAVELLARRAASVDPVTLAARLASDPLATLGGDRRADPPRHASVRATLQAAIDRLGPDGRAALAAAAPGDPEWVAAGWHEPDGPLPLVAAFLREPGRP